MNRFDMFKRTIIGAIAVPFVSLAPKLLVVEENAVNVPASTGGTPPTLVSETLKELLETGETIASELPPWTAQITSHWQRMPLETLKRVSEGAVKSFTWVYRYSNGTTNEWTELVKPE